MNLQSFIFLKGKSPLNNEQPSLKASGLMGRTSYLLPSQARGLLVFGNWQCQAASSHSFFACSSLRLTGELCELQSGERSSGYTCAVAMPRTWEVKTGLTPNHPLITKSHTMKNFTLREIQAHLFLALDHDERSWKCRPGAG